MPISSLPSYPPTMQSDERGTGEGRKRGKGRKKGEKKVFPRAVISFPPHSLKEKERGERACQRKKRKKRVTLSPSGNPGSDIKKNKKEGKKGKGGGKLPSAPADGGESPLPERGKGTPTSLPKKLSRPTPGKRRGGTGIPFFPC